MTHNDLLGDLLRRRDGIYSSDLLITAVSALDFFTWLGHNPSDAESICRTLSLKDRPADVMLTLFRSMGLLEVKRQRFSLTGQARSLLMKGGTNDLRPYLSSLGNRPVCGEILGVLRTGTPTNWSNDPKGADWAKAMEDPDFAESFTSAMESRGTALAPALARSLPCAGRSRILDIAGGSGIYAASILQSHPAMQGAILEKPPVDSAARESIRRRGLADRLSVVEADMFSDPWPTGYDIHLLSHVLHDWDKAEAVRLLRTSYEALQPGGLIAVYDVHVNRDKSGPIEAAEYSVLLMLSTHGKCYSIGEMEEMLTAIGFKQVRVCETAGFRSLMTARKPS